MKKNSSAEAPLYEPLVVIKNLEDFRSEEDREVMGDRRDGKLYRYTPAIKLYVNVALATGRPLLVLGPSGCGKSSLAFNLARVMKRRYYEFVTTSRSQARDLFYRFDAVRRLGEAHSRIGYSASQTEGESSDSQAEQNSGELPWLAQYPYIEPGPLWWILNRKSAEHRGYGGGGTPSFPLAVDPAVWSPEGQETPPAVLLIDEIDKAEPDFPNNLLVPLGSHQFMLEEVAKIIDLRDSGDENPVENTPLVVITSNRERELPEAFIRRCVVLEIQGPTVDDLVEVAVAVTGKQDKPFFRSIAEKMSELQGQQNLSTAEFLDAVYAIGKLNAQEPLLAEIVKSTTWRPKGG
jgi:MoxR-like ATPase